MYYIVTLFLSKKERTFSTIFKIHLYIQAPYNDQHSCMHLLQVYFFNFFNIIYWFQLLMYIDTYNVNLNLKIFQCPYKISYISIFNIESSRLHRLFFVEYFLHLSKKNCSNLENNCCVGNQVEQVVFQNTFEHCFTEFLYQSTCAQFLD